MKIKIISKKVLALMAIIGLVFQFSLFSPVLAAEDQTITPQLAVEQNSLPEDIWTTEDHIATTNDPVQLNQIYVAPQNSGVKIKFTKLPADPGKLSIQEITLNSDQVDALGATSNKAYDITSDMADGTFTYNLTLPHPAGASLGYIEKTVSEFEQNAIKSDIHPVSGKGINHFTIFIATYAADFTTSQTTYQQADTVHTLATGLVSSNYYRLAINPPGTSNSIFTTSSCDTGITFFAGDYALASDAAVSAAWAAAIHGFTSLANCNNGNANTHVASASATFSVTVLPVDTTAPTISGVIDGQMTMDDVTPTITDPDDSFTATLNGNPFTSGTTITDSGVYSLDAVDTHGNAAATVHFTIDKEGPTINFVSSSPDAMGELTTITADVTDNVAVADVEININDTGTVPMTSQGGSTYAYDYLVPDLLAPISVVVTAFDSTGNGAVQNYELDPLDLTAPVVTLLGEAEVTVEQNSVYTDAGATATDNLDGEITSLMFIVNPVDTSILGDYTVQYLVTDTAGNDAAPVDRIVHVVDITAPIITIDPYNTDPTNQDIIVTASTNEGTLNTTSYEFSENGSFDFVATDASGNTSVETVTITNVDKTAPQISPISDTVATTAIDVVADVTDTDSPSLNYIWAKVSGPGTVTFSPTQDNPAASRISADVNGSYVLSISATDLAGNQTIQDFNFTWNATNDIDAAHSTLVLPADASGTAIIVISSNFSGGQLDLNQVMVGDKLKADLNLEIQANIGGIPMTVMIAGGTIITGPVGWDGVVNLPQLALLGNIDLPTDTNMAIDQVLTFEIGLVSGGLSFDGPVSVTLAGVAGQKIGFTSGGVFYEITAACQTEGNVLPAGANECKKDSGQNLIIWTNHFTKFSAFSQKKSASHGGITGTLGTDLIAVSQIAVGQLTGLGQPLVGQAATQVDAANNNNNNNNNNNPANQSLNNNPAPEKGVLGASNSPVKNFFQKYLVWLILGGLIVLLLCWFWWSRRRE